MTLYLKEDNCNILLKTQAAPPPPSPQPSIFFKYIKQLSVFSCTNITTLTHPRMTRAMLVNKPPSPYASQMKTQERFCTNRYPFIFMSTHWAVGISLKATSWLPFFKWQAVLLSALLAWRVLKRKPSVQSNASTFVFRCGAVDGNRAGPNALAFKTWWPILKEFQVEATW